MDAIRGRIALENHALDTGVVTHTVYDLNGFDKDNKVIMFFP